MSRLVEPISRKLFAALLLVLGVQAAEASTWTFASGGNYATTSGTSYGNRMTFSQGSQSVRVSAWSDTGSAPQNAFESASIRRFSTGLGVCNRDEGAITACINGALDHQVDNVSQHDLVLFLFDSPQAMQSVTIDPYGVWDRDVSFWVGTVSASVDLSGANFGTLGALGFGNQLNSFNSAGEAPLTVTLRGLVGNALLVGGLYPADGSADRFKIRSLVTTAPAVVPVPAAVWLFLSALGSLAGLRRLA